MIKVTFIEAEEDSAEDDPAERAPATTDEQAGPSIKLYNMDDLKRKLGTISRYSSDRDERTRLESILGRMLVTGERRSLKPLAADWQQQLLGLQGTFPHFAELFDYLSAICALAVADDRTVRSDPILLVGPAGVGKTMLAEALAPIIASGFARISMSTLQGNATLVGSEEFWSNTKPGTVFRTLVEGKGADPLLLLDEIDKVSGDLRFHPLGALYDLLEPKTARQFCDLSVQDIPLDASRVIWMATANDSRFLPEPILSRFHVVHVPAPSRSQLRAVVRSVDEHFRRDAPSIGSMSLSEAAIEALLDRSPRELRKSLRVAYGRALVAGRREVSARDVPTATTHRATVGFA